MEALARAFVDHLIDSRYVGPNVPNSVGLTRRNLMNIYNLVSGQRRGDCVVSAAHNAFVTQEDLTPLVSQHFMT